MLGFHTHIPDKVGLSRRISSQHQLIIRTRNEAYPAVDFQLLHARHGRFMGWGSGRFLLYEYQHFL